MGSRTGRRRSTSGRDLVAYWENAADLGIVPENTAVSLRSACLRVLAVYPDWETIDVTRLDVEGALRAFTRAKERTLSQSTLQAYRSRFRRAVEGFLWEARGLSEWGRTPPEAGGPADPDDADDPDDAGGPEDLDDQDGQDAHDEAGDPDSGDAGGDRDGREGDESAESVVEYVAPPRASRAAAYAGGGARARAQLDVVKYDLPLAGGRLARLVLPVDLTAADVERLYAFLRTLPLPDPAPPVPVPAPAVPAVSPPSAPSPGPSPGHVAHGAHAGTAGRGRDAVPREDAPRARGRDAVPDEEESPLRETGT
ncbi:hypothetical protein [Bailinhaonella thermotolerans]|uniref:Core-binding (CB) domain-containing protein n=1 Tax=Bailinhaonella thermotolerans TaxID=1070861 RepID=A0A3A4A9P2_9ACTN|nr:hypothetical protein [Bailinhaonella thermotolerans]RJL23617.1 hypothetical protein D5H75_32470 [Bailinhaonella thermotolerans]